MRASQGKTIEDIIIGLLQRGPINTLELIKLVREKRPKTTKQGIYLALRNLAKEEIAVLHNKQASLNIRWIKRMRHFFAITEQSYIEDDSGKGNFISLKVGEKVEYSFADSATTDLFWWDALYILSELYTGDEPIYIYNPHEWFLIARKESEVEAIKEITKKHRLLLTAGNRTPLDKSVSKYFDGNKGQYYMSEKSLFVKSNYYFNIVGDFIIEVWLDKQIAAKIDEVYSSKLREDDAKTELIKIINGKGRSKLRISRNAKKAEKLKLLTRKYFYIPKSKK
jgi:hypothetical protein